MVFWVVALYVIYYGVTEKSLLTCKICGEPYLYCAGNGNTHLHASGGMPHFCHGVPTSYNFPLSAYFLVKTYGLDVWKCCGSCVT